jgi:hypothetical protein
MEAVKGTKKQGYASILAFVATLLFAPASQAAFVTLNEAGMDAIFSQANFGASPIDIRYGATTTIVRPDLLNITTDQGISDVFGLHVGAQDVVNFYFIDTMSRCGGVTNVNFIGCGELPGQDFVVESSFAAGATGAQLLAHELGHNLGLPHLNGLFLMNPNLNGDTLLTAAEVAIIRLSPLVHGNANDGFFIDINPVLIVAAAVPEPETYAMLLAGLGLLGWVGRRRRQQTA